MVSSMTTLYICIKIYGRYQTFTLVHWICSFLIFTWSLILLELGKNEHTSSLANLRRCISIPSKLMSETFVSPMWLRLIFLSYLITWLASIFVIISLLSSWHRLRDCHIKHMHTSLHVIIQARVRSCDWDVFNNLDLDCGDQNHDWDGSQIHCGCSEKLGL